jgi:integrase
MKPKRPLTAAGIKAIKIKSTVQEIRDLGAPGLYLTVQAHTGHKSWAIRFRRPDGRSGKVVIGPFDSEGETSQEPQIGRPLTLGAARVLANTLRRQRLMGKDLVAEHRARRQGGDSYPSVAIAFVERHAKPNTRGWREISRQLGLDPDGGVIPGGLADRWRSKSVTEIAPQLIHDVVEEARAKSVPGLGATNRGPSEARARHLFAALSKMFSWALRQRLVEANPCASVHRPEPGKSRDRTLTDAELSRVWHACHIVGEPWGSIFKLLILTGQRLREIGELSWDEIQEDLLVLPGTRTKNHRAHTVPLSAPAKEILDRQIKTGRFVFSTNGVRPPSGWSKAKARLDRIIGSMPDWRLHDIRRSYVTGISELGVRSEVAETAINHVSGHRSGVSGVYNKSILMAERKAAMDLWAAHVMQLVSGNVVRLAS